MLPAVRCDQLLPGDGCREHVPDGVAKPREGGNRRGGLGRDVVDPDLSQRVDDCTSREQVFDREAAIGTTCRDHRDSCAVAEFVLSRQDPCRDGIPRPYGTGEHCTWVRNVFGVRRACGEGIRPDHDVCAGGDGFCTRDAPIEADLVLGLVAGRTHRLRLVMLGDLYFSHVRVCTTPSHYLVIVLSYRLSLTQDGDMRVLLKLVLDCSPDAAWHAIREPAVMKDVAFPLMNFVSLEDDGFPESWPAGEHPVSVNAFGVLPLGEQVIDISFPRRTDGVRMVRDAGRGTSGMLGLVKSWRHTMAVSLDEETGGTLFRDELRFSAGVLTPFVWPVLWAVWQWRGLGLERFAWKWRAE